MNTVYIQQLYLNNAITEFSSSHVSFPLYFLESLFYRINQIALKEAGSRGAIGLAIVQVDLPISDHPPNNNHTTE